MLRSAIQAMCLTAFQEAFPEQSLTANEVPLTRATQREFGHFQCNAAMRLAKPLKQSPRAIADAVAPMLEKAECFSSVSVAGPGFINLTLSDSFLTQQLQAMLNEPQYGAAVANPQRVVVDFSSPNTSKEMHVGHLRSTIIGDSLARILAFQGHDVLRLNHVGDWGTSFGMLIAYLQEEHPDILQSGNASLSELVQWYKSAKVRFDNESEFKTRSQQAVVSLQSGDDWAFNAWQLICEISRKAYQSIYDRLDVDLIERGESFYNPLLKDTVSYYKDKGLAVEDNGAWCVFMDGFKNREGEPLPLMIQKSDGGYNYASTDLAALNHRITEENAERIVYVTDSGQATHFAMIFEAAKLAGVLPDSVKVDHVGFGLVLGPDGKKFKTRSGETVKLADLLDEAVTRAATLYREKQAESEQPVDEVLLQSISEAIGVGAVKYADLSCNLTSDYTFSFEKMLQFEGNTAAFLLYAYVRMKSILRKANVSEVETPIDAITLATPEECHLGFTLLQFPEIIAQVSDELRPNRLCDYLFQLANAFNAFFRECRVVGSEAQTARVALTAHSAKVLGQGLTLLGLRLLDQM